MNVPLFFSQAAIKRLMAESRPITHITDEIFLISPLKAAMMTKERKPIVSPVEILKVSGISIMVRNEGTAIVKSEKSIPLIFLNINTPTIIRAGAVANSGTALISGAKNSAKRKKEAVTIDDNPVFAPSAIPDADSI